MNTRKDAVFGSRKRCFRRRGLTERKIIHFMECEIKTLPGVKNVIRKEKIVEMAMNGAGTRDTGRVLGVSKDTATAVLKNEKVHSVSQRKVSFGAKRNGKDRYCGMQCIGSEM